MQLGLSRAPSLCKVGFYIYIYVCISIKRSHHVFSFAGILLEAHDMRNKNALKPPTCRAGCLST